MGKFVTFLDPQMKLADAAADALVTRVRKSSVGAWSLSHVVVLVPTAQSGRQLRLALARRFADRGGLLPPRVLQPMQLIVPSGDMYTEASGTALQASFLAFVRNADRSLSNWPHLFRPNVRDDSNALLGFLDQLNEIWRALAGGGWIMSDVPRHPAAKEVLTAAHGDEAVRWDELADFETAFFAFLNEHGLCHQAQNVHRAKTAAAPAPETEEIILPALTDPVGVLYNVLDQWLAVNPSLAVTVMIHAHSSDAVKFDTWGRPLPVAWTGRSRPVLTGLGDGDIVRAATCRALGDAVAAAFPEPDADAARPSLGLADPDLYSDLNAAFLNRGYHLYNPERHALSTSSLGVLINLLTEVWENADVPLPWRTVTALIRLDDVMSALCRAEPTAMPVYRTKILRELDKWRDAHFSIFVPQPSECGNVSFAAFRHALEKLNVWFEEARAAGGGASGFIRYMLKTVYAGRPLPLGDAGREFAAAAESARNVLEAVDTVSATFHSCASDLALLLRRAVAAAVYQMEPDSESVVKTEGWLELAWSTARRVVLAGFREGCVPDSLIGHAFLPDRLRVALGLTSNDRRLARDTYLLSELLACRAPGDVHAFIAMTDNAGDILRPSRLLFLCDDAALATRTERLFGDLGPTDVSPVRRPGDGWRFEWPSKAALKRINPSAIDAYLKCPFTYFLKWGLGLRPVREKNELGPDDFGTVMHAVLEAYARAEIARGTPLSEEAEIREELVHRFDEVVKIYGEHPPVGIRLQLDALRGRVLAFASIQARWAAAGWRVWAAEYPVTTKLFTETDIPFCGKIDRIDVHPEQGFRIIDYKTWDDPKKADAHLFARGKEEESFAAARGFPTFTRPRARTCSRLISIQLPLYVRALRSVEPTFGTRACDLCYLILGDAPDHVCVYGSRVDPESIGDHLTDLCDIAFTTAERAVSQMAAELFWPPGPGEHWRWDFGGLFLNDPEQEVSDTWCAQQKARLSDWCAAHDLSDKTAK